MDAREVAVREHLFADRPGPSRHHVDDAVGQTRLPQHFHQEVADQQRLRGRLPDHHVAHECRRGRQVARNRGEVEGRHGEHEPLQGAVLQSVPGRGVTDRLLRQQLVAKMHVEAPEVDQLAGRVNFGLLHRFALAQHGGGVDGVAPGAGQQRGGSQEDRGALTIGSGCPRGSRAKRGGDCRVDFRGAAAGVLSQHQLVVVRSANLVAFGGHHGFAADDHRDLGVGVCKRLQAGLH